LEIIGYIAGVLSIITYIPQVVKLYKTKTTEGLSILMIYLMCISVVLWMSYGFILHNIPMIITNALIVFLTILILCMVYKYKK
jgi:MtN3 and saliva related transmembrane protein